MYRGVAMNCNPVIRKLQRHWEYYEPYPLRWTPWRKSLFPRKRPRRMTGK